MNLKDLAGQGGLRKQASLVVIGDGITFASGLVSSMILARVIPVDEMGTYRQIIYLGPMAATLAEMGLSATVYRYWNALDNVKKNHYAKMIVAVSFLLGITASLILFGLAGLLSTWYKNPALKLALFITASFPLSTIPLMLVRPVLLSQGASLRATSIETIFSLLSTVSLVVPLLMGVSLNYSLGIWIVVSLLRLLIIPVIFRDYLRQKGHWWDWEVFYTVWNYLWPIQVGRLPGYIMGYMDKVVMSLYFRPREFAVYSLGAREIPFIGTIGPSIANVLIPQLVKDVEEGRHAQICRRWRLACEKTAVVTYLIAAFSAWHAGPIVRLLFSATYTESSVPFCVFSLLTFVRVIEYASLAKAFGRSDLIMQSAFVGAGVMVPLAFLLTRLWGAFGMASSVLIGTVASAAYLIMRYRKLLNCPIRFLPVAPASDSDDDSCNQHDLRIIDPGALDKCGRGY